MYEMHAMEGQTLEMWDIVGCHSAADADGSAVGAAGTHDSSTTAITCSAMHSWVFTDKLAAAHFLRPKAGRHTGLLVVGLAKNGEIQVAAVDSASNAHGGGTVLWHMPPALVSCTCMLPHLTADEDEGGRPFHAIALFVGTERKSKGNHTGQKIHKFVLHGQ